jgi:hypothetical protein
MMQANVYRRRRLVLRLERLRPPTLEAERVNDDRDSNPGIVFGLPPCFCEPVTERSIFMADSTGLLDGGGPSPSAPPL